ncbi:polyprotein [Plasmopara halstedii]|uniref:Polyprotein n=1 Tax=Plasmopara halstedii TaxID=4781 RepID=A0A0P1A5E2_PLAHL|nr:polyprotein [Plasmopara halstedii]CEG35593.1 polyprotein [Plasmopara halstedii]|eukprot:XP_024571962.1 polyprotein [Plasmopara halstedii]
MNCSPNTAHPVFTLYELAFKEKPQMDHFRVFGSQSYAHADAVKRIKLEPKSFKCMLLGYAENVKGYRVFDLKNAKVKVTCYVKLDEREVNGIDDTHALKPATIVQVIEDNDEVKIQHQVDIQPMIDNPVETVKEPVIDVKMGDIERTPSVDVNHLMASERSIVNSLGFTFYSTQILPIKIKCSKFYPAFIFVVTDHIMTA